MRNKEKAAVPLCGLCTVWASHISWYPFTIPLCLRTKNDVALKVAKLFMPQVKPPIGHKGDILNLENNLEYDY